MMPHRLHGGREGEVPMMSSRQVAGPLVSAKPRHAFALPGPSRIGGDPQKKREGTILAFHDSTMLTDNALFRKMAEACPDIDSKDARGRTVLMKVAASGDAEKAGILLTLGSDRKLTDASGRTAAAIALANCRPEIAGLIEGGGRK